MKQINKLIREEKYYNYMMTLAVNAIKDKKALHDLILTLEGMKLIS